MRRRSVCWCNESGEASALGFNLVYSNDSDALLERLAERLGTLSPNANLLTPEIILVPQFGLRRWLEIRLAERCGVLANVDFFAPAEYAWKLLRAANPDLREYSSFDRSALRWRIFAELRDLANDARFPTLRQALNDGAQSTRLQLAGELAQVFERYLAYRSDLLARWQHGEARNDWQAELWRRLTRAGSEPHRAQLLATFIANHAANDATPPGLPQRLFAFACTNISPDLLRFYGVVARHCAFDFFMPNPCREYWSDARGEKERLRERGAEAFDPDENPLLAGYGRAGREFVGHLFSYDHVQPDHESDLSIVRGRDSLLHCIQSDILERAAPSPAAQGAATDRSIQFHICHSRLREVQVLHDQLLDLFQNDATLAPRDVAIMAPDIAAYAPCIHAVFGSVTRDSPLYLPYTLSDCSASEAHPLIAFAMKLIALPLSRMGLTELIELLSEPAVLRKLDLSVNDIDQLATWLHEAGVRWGVDEHQHEAFGAGNYREFSWEFGLDRLLLGYASGAVDSVIEGIAPAALIEGSAAQTLGALLGAWNTLKNLLDEQRQAHTPTQWQKIYNIALQSLLDIDPDDRAANQAMEAIRGALAALAEDSGEAGMAEPLDWPSVRDFLGERLREAERSYRFFSAGISVCGMLPLRVVPFRVICLIGMGDEAFPHRDRTSALLREHADSARGRLRSERSERDEDRYLFLQLLTSVRDIFYMSWVGEEPRDGMLREPSSVVAELLDVLCKSYLGQVNQARDQLVVKHPLQPFSPRHFDGSDTRVFTYRRQWRHAASRAGGAQTLPAFVDAALEIDPSDGGLDTPIDLDDLQDFWRNPARAFFKDQLGLRLLRREDENDDADPLDLDGLLRYQLIDSLIKADLHAPSAPALAPDTDAAAWRARALLPAGFGGEIALAEARLPARELSRAIKDHQADGAPVDTQPFTLTLPSGARLTGRLPRHSDGLLCRYSAGSINASRLLRAWIELLVLATQTTPARLLLFGWDKAGLQQQRVSSIDSKHALEQLDRLLGWYRAGRCRPLLFFPRASHEYVARWRKTIKADSTAMQGDTDSHLRRVIDLHALEQAHTIFIGTAFGGAGESAEPAFALAARGLDVFIPEAPATRDFVDCAVDVYAVLLDALQVDE